MFLQASYDDKARSSGKTSNVGSMFSLSHKHLIFMPFLPYLRWWSQSGMLPAHQPAESRQTLIIATRKHSSAVERGMEPAVAAEIGQ
jgi:hypothetical protein